MEMSAYGTKNEAMRETWIKKELEKLPKGLKILNVGAGDQHHKQYCSHLEYTSQDFVKYDGKGDGKGLQTSEYDYGDIDIKSDITSIPIKDSSFDVILCAEVLEHIPHPNRAIAEMSRLLCENGTLILTAPFCSLTHFAPYHYYAGFNSYWYNTVLPSYGLQVTKMQVYGDYFQYLAQELHRLAYVASKYSADSEITKDGMEAVSATVSLLEKLGKPGNTSWELLAFGYLVVLKKLFAVSEKEKAKDDPKQCG